MTNATGTAASITISLDANLVAGPSDHITATLWYHQLFGLFAYQRLTAGPIRIAGRGPAPNCEVVLTVDGRSYRSVTDGNGRYAFRAPTIPDGAGILEADGRRSSVIISTSSGSTESQEPPVRGPDGLLQEPRVT